MEFFGCGSHPNSQTTPDDGELLGEINLFLNYKNTTQNELQLIRSVLEFYDQHPQKRREIRILQCFCNGRNMTTGYQSLLYSLNLAFIYNFGSEGNFA